MRTVPETCDQELRTGAKKERCLQGKSLLLCTLIVSTLLGFTLLITYIVMTCGLGSCDAKLGLTLLTRLLNSRNDTVDPCEDFYKYACGSWEGKHSSRTTEESLNVFDVLLEENQLILKRLLESPQFGIKGSAKEKAIQFYRSCMDTQRIESQGSQPLKDLLNQVGGWNITDVGKAKDFNETLQTLMGRYSTFPFFRVHVGPSPFDLKANVIQIDHPEFEVPLESKFKEKNYLEVLRVYLSYLKKLGGLLGVPQDGSPDLFSPTLFFISKLQRVVTPLQERKQRGMLFFRTTIRELQEKAPAIDWLSCLQAVFHPMPMNLSQPIVVHDMDYLRGMSQLIEEWQKERLSRCSLRSKKPSMANWISWSGWMNRLAKKLKSWCVQKAEVTEAFLSLKPLEKEWKGPAPSHIPTCFYRHTILNVLYTRKIVSKLQVEIGYPAHILQTAKVNLEYQNVSFIIHITCLFPQLEINEDTFFLNVVACLEVLRENSYLKLLQHRSQDNWRVSPWAVHSYYSIRHHMVVFPAGMFRSPFFHMDFPSAVNFGAIGVFMAHELLHTFYDYVQPGGCPTCNRSALQKSIDCLVEHYESYSFKVNGTFTLLENTADVGGLTVAYQAYKNWLKKHKEKDLPKIGLSHDQLFYLSFAHAMCGHQDPEKLQSSPNIDPHSPLPLRVCGPVSNSQDFAKHFHCSSGSPMNPVNKCHIW
ncbi:kell blood group glycoprotein isoform X4 [Rissa tridactyla]|uniref:kell blood group glycoprotein isoform X4 n=1 Tax=Rissa tridactyla TaxID=75485 RepID=UPI0023BA88A4|nr:kell blood group glycoprotein isoform X4 [Rissa tridactyla]